MSFNAKTSSTNLDVRFEGLVGLDDDALGAMSDELTELMHKTFSQILSGADAPTVYRTWREMTLPLVERDEAERSAYPTLFTRHPGYGAPKARTDARMEDRVQIAFTFDQNLLKYVPNVIRSIEANTSEGTEYHLLVRGLSDEDMRGMENLLPGPPINWHAMDGQLEEVDYIGLTDRIPISTMDRCLLPDVLPHIDKILYLDTDIIVLGDVADLYRWPLGDSPLGAVQHWPLGVWVEDAISDRYSVDSIRVLRFAASIAAPMYAPAFNAGVLLLSLDAMRRDQFTSQAVENLAAFGFDGPDSTQPVRLQGLRTSAKEVEHSPRRLRRVGHTACPLVRRCQALALVQCLLSKGRTYMESLSRLRDKDCEIAVPQVLEVDHIRPKSDNRTDACDNLLRASAFPADASIDRYLEILIGHES